MPMNYLTRAVEELAKSYFIKNAESKRILDGLEAARSLEKSGSWGAIARSAGKSVAKGALPAAGAAAVLVPTGGYMLNRAQRQAEDSYQRMSTDARNKALQIVGGSSAIGIGAYGGYRAVRGAANYLERRGSQQPQPQYYPQHQVKTSARVAPPVKPKEPPKPPAPLRPQEAIKPPPPPRPVTPPRAKLARLQRPQG